MDNLTTWLPVIIASAISLLSLLFGRRRESSLANKSDAEAATEITGAALDLLKPLRKQMADMRAEMTKTKETTDKRILRLTENDRAKTKIIMELKKNDVSKQKKIEKLESNLLRERGRRRELELGVGILVRQLTMAGIEPKWAPQKERRYT